MKIVRFVINRKEVNMLNEQLIRELDSILSGMRLPDGEEATLKLCGCDGLCECTSPTGFPGF